MTDFSQSTAEKPDIPEEMQDRWQRVLNLMASTIGVPAGAVMKADPPQIQVFLATEGEGNPFRRGDRLELKSDLYCERVIREKAPLQVSDALEDPEWKDSPMIRMGMTYYLGFPLLWPDGEIFGSICVFDRKDNPQATRFYEWVSQIRQLIEKDLYTLVRIGEREELLAELQRHRDHLREMVDERTADLAKSERVLAEAQHIAHLGSWEWDIRSGTHRWSDEVFRIFGLLPQKVEASYERFLSSVHPEDRRRVDQANQKSISDPEKPYSIEYRVVQPDGTERVVYARAEVLFDQNRGAVRMIGTIQDITERKHAEEALKKAFQEIKKLKEQLEAENIYLRGEVGLKSGFEEIIGVSDAIKYAMQRTQQVAPTGTTVLLSGETGTGKGLFARSLHQASSRRDKPFVNVNCAGLPANLIESELFGREKGAFTGSTARQIGRFELANGGTIFLDEIGELPLELQTKLLKVIEDREFERLGSPRTVKVDVRIIASTNRDLREEIKRGRFRQDLFFRLNVFPITIPPLRERKADIPLLVKFYVTKFSKSYGKRIERVPRKTMQFLENYAWPGNVRELSNVIERAVIVSDGQEFRLVEQAAPLWAGPARNHGAKGTERQEIKALAAAEREHILRTLKETGWRIEGRRGAAQLLELHPNTLRARMKKLGIKRPGTA